PRAGRLKTALKLQSDAAFERSALPSLALKQRSDSASKCHDSRSTSGETPRRAQNQAAAEPTGGGG
ncbi:MAG TPA: hypothetical protein VMS10_00310, partial [Methyloceanibacter sp.]|nr:hypothetical protein [Methyloceanibacter sp.]